MTLEKDQLPAAPSGPRILTRPTPPKEEENGIAIPEIAQQRAHFGTIVHAGLTARDTLYDQGHQIGDDIWWGKFAGVVEEWDHIIIEGPTYKKCKAHDWARAKSPGDRMHEWKCSHCESVRRAEPVIVMNVDDILCNVSLQRRMESGEVGIVRGKTVDGRTHHILDRKDK